MQLTTVAPMQGKLSKERYEWEDLWFPVVGTHCYLTLGHMQCCIMVLELPMQVRQAVG